MIAKRLRLFLTIGLLLALLLILNLDKVWTIIAGEADLGPVNFAELVKSPKPNQYLICPRGYCLDREIDAISPIYQVSMMTLSQELIAIIEADTSITKVAEDEASVRYVKRSRVFRFPDTINIAFYSTESGSTLSIYSRSQLGYSDLGVNKRRIVRWLEKLDVSLVLPAGKK